MAPGLLELLLVSAFLVDATHLNSSGPGQDEHFTHQLVLDKEEKVHLSWRTSEQGVTFLYSVATHGYIGLGFSPSGGMHGADIMLAWVDRAGEVHVTDRHAVGNNVPYLDTKQSYRLERGYENETHTVVQVSRD